MNWLAGRPEHLVDRAEPSDLLPELRATSVLTPVAWRTLDLALRQWTLRALSRPADVEGLLELDDLIGLAVRALPGDPETEAYRGRWRAFRDLLESKRLAIGGRQSGRAKKLLHADAILKALAAGGLRQSELQERLGVSAQRLSQILAVMEEGGLIDRVRRGRDKLVSLVRTEGQAERVRRTPGQERGMGAQVWRQTA